MRHLDGKKREIRGKETRARDRVPVGEKFDEDSGSKKLIDARPQDDENLNIKLNII